MQFTEYKLVPLVRGILTSALPLFLREIVADLSNADAKRTTVLIHLLLLHHSSIFQNIYVCTYIYFRFTGNIFCGKKKNQQKSQVSFFSGDLNDFHAA